MASLPSEQAPFTVIETHQGVPSRSVHYRISVGSSVKYLKGPKPLSAFPDDLGEHLGFKTVPTGDWDVGHLVVGPDGKFLLVSTEKRRFPDLTPTWHPSKVNLLDLGDPYAVEPREDYEIQLRAHIPSGPYPGTAAPATFQGVDTVLAFWNIDFANMDSHGLAAESHVYSLLQGKFIAPRFLAHLTDNDERVIGYVIESVPGVRSASIDDLDLCRKVLQELHDLGIVHGNLSRYSFLIREDSSAALLQWFFMARETANQAYLDAEMASLESVLREPLREPRKSDDDNEQCKELTAIMNRDGYIHPVLYWQLQHDGQITLSEEDHRALIAEMGTLDRPHRREDLDEVVERLKENGGRLP